MCSCVHVSYRLLHNIMDADYTKRVYQGVRVKHTVKDLLAEKRSRQTNGPQYSGRSTTPPSFVQMPAGSHMLPNYYGTRRPFISDSDFSGSSKQFSPDMYSSCLSAKSMSCEPTSMNSHSTLIDSYYPETYADYRSTAAFSSTSGSYLPSSALQSFLPPFSGESSHLFLRDLWEQADPEPVQPVETLCSDGLAVVNVPASIPSPEPEGSPSQYRSPSQGLSMCPVSTSQAFTLHTQEDAHYHALKTNKSCLGTNFTCLSYMSGDLSSKLVTDEESESNAGAPQPGETPSSWAKEDVESSWSSYEIRRAY